MYISVSFLCPVFYTFLTTCSFLIRISLLYSRHHDWWASRFNQLLAKCFHFSHHLPVRLPGCDLFFFLAFFSSLCIFCYAVVSSDIFFWFKKKIKQDFVVIFFIFCLSNYPEICSFALTFVGGFLSVLFTFVHFPFCFCFIRFVVVGLKNLILLLLI